MSNSLPETKLSLEEIEIVKEIKKIKEMADNIIKKTVRMVFDKKPKLTYLSLSHSRKYYSLSILESELSMDQIIDLAIEDLETYPCRKYKITDHKTPRTDEMKIQDYKLLCNRRTDPPTTYIDIENYFKWTQINPNNRSLSEKNFPKKDGYDLFKLFNTELAVFSRISELDHLVFDRNLNTIDLKLVVEKL